MSTGKRRTQAALLMTSALTVMAGATIAPSLPAIERHFASVGHAGLLVKLVLTVPAFFTALCAPLAGHVIDRFGRLRFLFAGLALYVAAGTSGLWVDALWSLLAGRALLGLAVALILTASITLIADHFGGPERERFMGVHSASMGLTALFCLTAGGMLADLHWRAPFAVYALAVFAAFASGAWLRESPDVVSRRMSRAQPGETPVPRVQLTFIYACGLFGMLLFYCVPVQLPFYLRELGEVSATRAGLAIAASTLAGSLTALQYGRVHGRLHFVSIFALMFALVALAFLWLSQARGYSTVVLTMLASGLGFGLLVPNSNVWLTSFAPERLRGRLIGGLMTCFFVGQFVSPLVTQPIAARHGLGGWSGVYGVAGFAAAAAALVFVGGKRWRSARA